MERFGLQAFPSICKDALPAFVSARIRWRLSAKKRFLDESRCWNRVWKGFCVIRDLAEIDCVIRESKINPAVNREYYIGCDAGFA